MIDGLKVMVPGEELIQICLNRVTELHAAADKNEQLAKAFDREMEAVGKTSNIGPRDGLEEKAKRQRSEAQELAFLAAHLNRAETYQLDRSDLVRIGVVKEQWR